MKTAVHTDNAPKALGPYSQAIRAGGCLYVSGQLGLDPATMAFSDAKCVKSQTDRALLNLKNIIEGAGLKLEDVVSTTVLLADMGDFAAVNEIYSNYFPPVEKEGDCPPPARACFAVKELPKSALVEITAIVHAA